MACGVLLSLAAALCQADCIIIAGAAATFHRLQRPHCLVRARETATWRAAAAPPRRLNSASTRLQPQWQHRAATTTRSHPHQVCVQAYLAAAWARSRCACPCARCECVCRQALPHPAVCLGCCRQGPMCWLDCSCAGCAIACTCGCLPYSYHWCCFPKCHLREWTPRPCTASQAHILKFKSELLICPCAHL